MSQEGRVADDELGGGPFRLGWVVGVGQVEDGVGLADGVHGGEDRLPAVVDAVRQVPLDVADPEGGAGQLGGVGVDLEAKHLVRLHPGVHILPVLGIVEVDDLLLEVEEGAEGGVEEIAATAGGIEDLHGGEPVLKRL